MDPTQNFRTKAKLLIPTSLAGWLIGKQGKTIREMQMNSGAFLHLLREDDPEVPPTLPPSDRVLEVCGRYERKLEGIQVILRTADQIPGGAVPVETQMLIPQLVATPEALAEVAAVAGCSVGLQDNLVHGNDEVVVTITGSVTQRTQAAQALLSKIDKAHIEGKVVARSPDGQVVGPDGRPRREIREEQPLAEATPASFPRREELKAAAAPAPARTPMKPLSGSGLAAETKPLNSAQAPNKAASPWAAWEANRAGEEHHLSLTTGTGPAASSSKASAVPRQAEPVVPKQPPAQQRAALDSFSTHMAPPMEAAAPFVEPGLPASCARHSESAAGCDAASVASIGTRVSQMLPADQEPSPPVPEPCADALEPQPADDVQSQLEMENLVGMSHPSEIARMLSASSRYVQAQSQVTLLLPNAVLTNYLLPRQLLPEVAQRCLVRIDILGDASAAERQVVLAGTVVSTSVALFCLQELVSAATAKLS